MPLIRSEHDFDGRFTQVPNDWLRDGRLSLRARGLLALLMSHTVGWSVTVNSLTEQNPEGRDSIKAAVSELEQFGYLVRVQNREAGKFAEATWRTQSPQTEKPSTVKPSTEKPQTVNPHLKNTKEKNTNTKNTIDSEPVENPRKGATRIPADFEPDPKHWDAKQKAYPWLNLELETEKFKNHWTASAAPSAVKRDWQAAWRTWILNASEWSKPNETPRTRHKFTMED